MCRPRHPQTQGVCERSHEPFKRALAAAMVDANTDNWVALVPIVQGMLNNRVAAGYTRSPYELVFGCRRREGYRNNALPKAVMQILTNELGIDAIEDCGSFSTIHVVRKRLCFDTP